MRRVNHGTITGTLSWYKILPLNGFNLTRAKQKLLRRRKRVYETFSSRHISQELFTLTIHWSLANPVKNYHGIIELLHLIDPRQMASLRLIPQKEEEFIFPIADGTAKLLGRDYEFREPTQRQAQTVRSEDLSGELLGEPEEPQPTESRHDAEARKDSWSIQG